VECILRWLDDLDCSVYAAVLVCRGANVRRWLPVVLTIAAGLVLLL
jgi:hypothetical protein